jgi:type VI secretion system secreted protein VgrG
VRLKDYDYTKPALDVSGSAPVSSAGLGEISVHGARFFSPTAGGRLARLRAGERLARAAVFTGSGTALYLRAGYTFELHDHPRFDASYLAIEVEHHGSHAWSTREMRRRVGLDGDDVYRADVTAIPASVQFRAESRTPWPRIYGYEHGLVDGEADSDYAQIDEHGRYLVRFAFDESDLGAGKASTRLRMMQPHGGAPEGWHFPLRKGTEVLFLFLGGDPDRPVIAGVVPNAETPSPVTKKNLKTNVIETGGRNRFELEDEDGAQRVTLSTPQASTFLRMGAPVEGHEMTLHTDGSTLLDTGGDMDVLVEGNLTEAVDGTTTETYTGDHCTSSLATRTIRICGAYSQTCDAGVTRTVAADESHVVAGAVSQHYGTQTRLVDGTATHIVSGSELHMVSGPVTQTHGPTFWSFASLFAIIPGGATILTPEWKVVSPDQNWLTAAGKFVFGEEMESSGLKSELVGMGIEVTVVKTEAVSIQAETVGVHFERTAFKQENRALEWSKAGLTLKQRGVGLLCFGLCKIG